METLLLAAARPFTPVMKGKEGRVGPGRDASSVTVVGRGGFYELLLFCQSYVRLDCLPRAECGRPVVGKSAGTLKWEKK